MARPPHDRTTPRGRVPGVGGTHRSARPPRHLDPVGEPVTRHQFRSTLEAELDSTPASGRVASATASPSDRSPAPWASTSMSSSSSARPRGCCLRGRPAIRSCPMPTANSPGLATADARSARLHRLLLPPIATSSVTLTLPRGDLRATSPAPALALDPPWTDQSTAVVESHHAGLEAAEFPASDVEHRLRGRYATCAPERLAGCDDRSPSLPSARALIATRSTHGLRRRPDRRRPPARRRVSPTRLESWIKCPHAYFAQHLLSVRPVEEPGDEITITARDKGPRSMTPSICCTRR